MAANQNHEQELLRRQKELEAREQAIRLRELEVEIDSPSVQVNMKMAQPENRFKLWLQKFSAVLKAAALGVAVMLGIISGVAIFWLVIFGGVAWLAYKFLFAPKRNKYY